MRTSRCSSLMAHEKRFQPCLIHFFSVLFWGRDVKGGVGQCKEVVLVVVKLTDDIVLLR